MIRPSPDHRLFATNTSSTSTTKSFSPEDTTQQQQQQQQLLQQHEHGNLPTSEEEEEEDFALPTPSPAGSLDSLDAHVNFGCIDVGIIDSQEEQDDDDDDITMVGEHLTGDAAIVRHIASFLTLSDAAASLSLDERGGGGDRVTTTHDADSWAVGTGMEGTTGGGGHSLEWSLATPPTPALVRLSPGATPAPATPYRHNDDHDDDDDEDEEYEEDYEIKHSDNKQPYVDTSYLKEEATLEQRLQERRRQWAQEKLATAVFSHTQPLRSFCLDAYRAAQQIRQRQQQQQLILRQTQHQHERTISISWSLRRLLQELLDLLFHNVPLSVFIDVTEAITGLSLETTVAGFRVTISSIQGLFSAFGYALKVAWHTVTNLNPFSLLEAIISLQFNAMGKTSEVLVSGIQSVATGVESASSLALNRLSGASLGSAAHRNLSSGSLGATAGGLGGSRASLRRPDIHQKLLEKMSSMNDAARVVRYLETGDDTGGLTRHAISRTRRMMHYSISLRPFVATVAIPASTIHPPGGGNLQDFISADRARSSYDISDPSTLSEGSESPIICSPQSFPPTPNHRRRVMAQSSQFADDVVFLARDRLRIHTGLESEDERTREMARALREGKRLAIFDACAHGIQLTCGQHIATKVGTMHYASTRSMVPILRNCHVYFEITVMPPFMPRANHSSTLTLPAPPITLAIGLSTAEMPPNTLVGAWQGSVGLCSTGQILAAGQWSSPADPSMSAYGYTATVGCLVFIDDASAFETWDGVMVHASVTFNINGVVVPPPLSTVPFGRSQPPRRSQPPFRTHAVVVPASEELYPTVSLQTPATAVMCRFSNEDVTTVSRENMGVPEDVVVYAVDGSVIVGSHGGANDAQF